MPRHRYSVLDTYRFFAAIGVVIYHFERHFSPLRGGLTDNLDRFQTLVDFFFVLSGFVLMHTYKEGIHDLSGYVDFLRKRLARIYPLHAATVLIWVGIITFVVVEHVTVRYPELFDIRLVPANLLLIHAWGTTDKIGLNFPSWSISAEMFVYLLFPAFAALLSRFGAVPTLIVAAIVAITVEVLRAALGLRPGYVATFDYGMLRAVPSFLAGMAVCRIVEARPAVPTSWHIPNAMAVVVVVLMVVKAPTPLIDACYPILVGLIAAADRGGRPTLLASPSLIALGNASFAIYMLHSFVQIACVMALRRLGWTGLPALFAMGAAGTVVIIICGLVSFKYFETPWRRRLGGPKAQAITQPKAQPELVSAVSR